MERREFIKTCCCSIVGGSATAALLQSCGTIYYATSTKENDKIVIPKTEFIEIRKNRQVERKFVLLNLNDSGFPICLYKTSKDIYTASLLKCTHRGCELNVGGGIYTCPCHGSEFSTLGEVLEGPADRNLKTYKTVSDNENIYIYLQ